MAYPVPKPSKRWRVIDSDLDKTYWTKLTAPGGLASSVSLSVVTERQRQCFLRGEIVLRKPKRSWTVAFDDRPTAVLVHPDRRRSRIRHKTKPQFSKDWGHGGKPGGQRENVSNLEADKRARPLNATDAEYDMSTVCLGQGAFATVFAARRRSDGHRVACESWRQICYDFLTPASWKHGLLDGSGTSVPTINGPQD